MNVIRTIHGAGATARSFTWLEENLQRHLDSRSIGHLSHALDEPLDDIIARFRAYLDGRTGYQHDLIGHSLGGVIAVALSDHPAVRRVVAIAAPFGGSRAANVFRWFSASPLFESIRPENAVLRRLRGMEAPQAPTLCIVATSGLPHIHEPNDGVLTVQSQSAIHGATMEYVDASHYEVLMTPRTIGVIAEFLQ